MELRDPRLPDELRVAYYVANGVPRPRASAHVDRYRRAQHAQQRLREELGGLPGRKPRWRGAAREAEALRRDGQRAVVEEGARALSLWTQLRGELAHRASAPGWYDTLAHVRCERETLDTGGEIVLHLGAPAEVRAVFERERERIEEIAKSTLPVRVRLVWEEDCDQQWAALLRAWAAVPGAGKVWLGWLASLRCAGWAVEEGELVVRVSGPADVLDRLVFRRAMLEGRAEDALGKPVRISWEPS